MFSQLSNGPFNNVLFSPGRIWAMDGGTKHPSMQRLYHAASTMQGITGQSSVARALNASPQTVKNWESRGISKAGAIAAQERFGCNAAWLLEGNGPMISEGYTSPRKSIDLEGNDQYPAIRRVRFKLSAGASGYALDYLDEEGAPIVFQREWFDSRGYDPAKLFAVKVINHSMEPGLHDGDVVVVNTGDTELRDGRVFAMNYEGELVIKRMIRDGGQWWLASDNPDQRKYPRKVCSEDVHCIGRIVHKQSEEL